MSLLAGGYIAVRARMSGKVQGVGYRNWVQATAIKLGLYGWVRNREDSTVEALFCGAEAAVNEMLALAKLGPEKADVTHIETSLAQGIAPHRFDIKPTV